MPSPQQLEKAGLTAEKIKSYWTAKKDSEDRIRLKALICNRLRDGIGEGLRNHKVWWALDLAYDAPFNQITPTLVQAILSRNSDTKAVKDALMRWNVSVDDIVVETMDEKGCKKPAINVPAFYQVLVPLVKAYVTIRRAKLFNDRNLTPLFKYEPYRSTATNRILGEIITDMVQQMTTELGYGPVLRQAILQCLQYGQVLMFPKEEWYSEKFPDDTGKDVTEREGLRYHMPHPTRTFMDLSQRPSTINTDTGCEFAGYWYVDRYDAVKNNRRYWNTDNINYGSSNWMQSYPTYFTEVFPCALKFPSIGESGVAGGIGTSDRESRMSTYSQADEDKAVFLTNLYMKVNPKDYGLADYDHPVWMRFVVAADDTVLWNAPVCYNPVLWMGYDADENRSRQSSLSLEVLPWQDAVGNLISQQLLSVKQNLGSRMVWYDKGQVDADQVRQVENLGHKRYSSVPFLEYDSRKARVAGNDIKGAFVPVSFPQVDTVSIANTIGTILSILDRLLVLSAQETGQAATHEQTAEETRIISANTSTRVLFTGTFVDDFIDAWKRQLYRASKSYRDDELEAQVSLAAPGTEKILKDLGFVVVEKIGDEQHTDARVRALVKGKLSKIDIDALISQREGENRVNNTAIAAAMSQLVQVAMNNPMTAQAIGPQQALDLITEIGRMAGLPRDFRLIVSKDSGKQEQEQQAQVVEQVNKMAEQIQQGAVQAATEQVGKPLADELVQTNSQIKEIGQVVAALLQKIQGIEAAASQAGPLPEPNIPSYAPSPEPSYLPGGSPAPEGVVPV